MTNGSRHRSLVREQAELLVSESGPHVVATSMDIRGGFSMQGHSCCDHSLKSPALRTWGASHG